MSLKNIKTISIFVTFALCFVTHFVYSVFPNFLTSIFFPVNESIWEHMKMLVSAILIWEMIEYFLLKKYRINHNNFYLSVFIQCLFSIFVFFIIYLPIYYFAGDNFIIDLVCLFISIYFESVFSFYILNNCFFNMEIIGVFGMILLYILFGLFTYFPLKNDLFLDKIDNKYGINTYVV